MAGNDSIRFVSFNCRSVKRSINEIKELCLSYDIILLQEHWLFPFELDYLTGISEDFYAYSKSAMDPESNVVKGRPYGGTAILFRKCLLPVINCITVDSPRITAVNLTVDINSRSTAILIASVYMPVDDDVFDDEFEFVCGALSAMMVDTNVNHFIFAGDFNFRFLTNRHSFIMNSLSDYNVKCADQTYLLPDSFTYVSDVHNTTSWLDHVLVNSQLLNNIDNMCVNYNSIASDHKPVIFNVRAVAHSQLQPAADDSDSLIVPDWDACTYLELSNYAAHLDQLLALVTVPDHCGDTCSNINHMCILDNYYRQVTDCLKTAMYVNIPVKKCKKSQFCVAGWNDMVEEKHVAARLAFVDWVNAGKPRYGYIFDIMKVTRAKFKLAFRYCKQNEDMLKCDAIAQDFLSRSGDFWKKVKKSTNSKMTKFANTVNGVDGDIAIANMWKESFESLYNSNLASVSSNETNETRAGLQFSNEHGNYVISVDDLVKATAKIKNRKACGPDGIPSEAIKYGGRLLITHLSLAFNMFLTHSYLPADMICTTFVPLLKNKSGDISDINNYRAIALSNAISKFFEDIILDSLHQYDNDDDMYQFGFKAGHSTTMGCHVLKRVIDYYRSNGSYVFTCFLDLTKAFDRVNHDTLFRKLAELNFPKNIIQLIMFWYKNQQVNVRWKNSITGFFHMSNGTRQGSVLSPYLFGIYMREVSYATTSSGVGCFVGSLSCNIILYADDIVLLAPSWRALQKLINICVQVTAGLDMVFNANKSVSMIFEPYDVKKHVTYEFPVFKINDHPLQVKTDFKYLGTVISNDLLDDLDISRQMGLLYARTNFLIRKFYKCSYSVKLCLFKTYCLNIYNIALWDRFHKSVLRRMESAYVKCVKMFFGFARMDSVTNMFMELRLVTFKTLLSNAKLKFNERCVDHPNKLLSMVHLICS